MTRAQQSIVNRRDVPIYVSVEVAPDCYELEPGDRLTLIYDVPHEGDALEVEFINESELVVWPGDGETTVLINGQSAKGRSWKSKHHPI